MAARKKNTKAKKESKVELARLQSVKAAKTSPIISLTPTPTPKSKKREKSPEMAKDTFDLNDADVVNFIARVVIIQRMSYRNAVKELLGDVKESKIDYWTSQIRTNKEVRVSIEEQLDDIGLGEKAKESFRLLMHNWLEFGDVGLMKTAAIILGKAYLGEKIVSDKPIVLQITGLEEGLKDMGVTEESDG